MTRRSAARGIAALAAALALGGCAAPQSSALRNAPPDGLERRALLEAVPFLAQQDFHCGPASLAMAMAAAGRPVAPEAIAPAVFVPGLQGSLQAEMLSAPRRLGMLATRLPGTLDALLREVAGGTPVVVLQNLGLGFAPLWHYAVVVGFDLATSTVLLHSGETPRLPMRLDTFEFTWARGGHWAIAVTDPARLPRTASEAEALRAAVALERTDARAAATAYGTVLQRWPASRLALLGRANLRYQDGDLAGAIDGYRATVAAHPDFADAWNNLATALLDRGERDGARAAIERAIALGGPRLAVYQATRERLAR